MIDSIHLKAWFLKALFFNPETEQSQFSLEFQFQGLTLEDV